jgi:asparagine synthase (glutamine-hydrolysing)
VADLLPPNLVHAGKRGFVIPLKLWLRDKLRPLAEAMLNPTRLQAQGIFRPEFYGEFVRPHLDGRADYTQKVWAALMFQLWHHVYVDAPTSNAPTYDLKALSG